MKDKELQLVNDEEARAERLFDTVAEYYQFSLSFQQQVKGDLDRYSEARRQSEEQAKQHLVF